MKLDGRRMSDNISDRRGERMNMAVVAAVVLATQGTSGLSGLLGVQSSQTEQTQYKGTPEEQELYKFSAQILAGTEDVWTELFKRMGILIYPSKDGDI